MSEIELKSKIESILFVSNKPIPLKTLAKLLEIDAGLVKEAARTLQTERAQSGVVILEANDEFQMATNAANAPIVKSFLNADLREKLTDATIEVLGIIAYRQPISKAEIEAIRGVNSQYSIRQLLMRGLIEKVQSPSEGRGNQYQVTTEFLQHLGIQSVQTLPDFETLTRQIKLPESNQQKPMQDPQTTPSTETPPQETHTEHHVVQGVDIEEPQLPPAEEHLDLPPAEPAVPQPPHPEQQ